MVDGHSQKTMKYVLATALTLGLVAFGWYTNSHGDSEQGLQPPPAADASVAPQYVVGIEGMSCALNCAPRVKEALESIDGVHSAEVSFDDKRAVVKMAPGQSLTQDACDQSFGNSGYFVSSFEEGAAEGG